MNRAPFLHRAALALLALTIQCAHATDLDVVSELVSYQFLDTLADAPAKANVVSSLVSYQYLDSLNPLPSQPNLISALVSYRYLDSLAGAPTDANIVSPLVSYLYFDWPGDANLTFQTSPTVSYYFNGPPQILTSPADRLLRVGSQSSLTVVADGSLPLSYQWLGKGVAIPGAIGATLVLNNAQLSDSGDYSVVVSNAHGIATSQSARVVVYAGAPDIQPALPTLVATTQPLAASLTAQPRIPTSAQLIVFNTRAGLDPTVMTIVLTHGWENDAWDWPASMAQALKARYGDTVNIVAWNWSDNSLLNPLSPAPSAARTKSEGTALANALMDTLGVDYNRPIHFMGHSLGTLVNCAAADYLHGDQRPRGDPRGVTETYSSSRTHMTLFDEAELVTAVNGLHVMLDSVLAGFSEKAAIDGAMVLKNLWSNAVPKNSRWVDNYISEVGSLHSDAANVILWPPLLSDGNFSAHGYAYEWYQWTVKTPQDSKMGHRWSFEANTIYPWGIGSAPALDSYFRQNRGIGVHRLSLSEVSNFTAGLLKSGQFLAYSSDEATKGLHAAGAAVQGKYDGIIQYAGNLVVNYAESFSAPPGTPVYLNTAAGSTAAYFAPVSEFQSAPWQASHDLQLIIQPAPAPAQSRMTAATKTSATAVAAGAAPIYVIVPMLVPLEAVGLSFEYSITGGAVDEFMTMGIGQSVEYSMEAKFLKDGAWNGTPVIPVSDLRNQRVDLVFALNGVNAAPSGTLSIRNIQFYIPPRPELTLEVQTGGALKASWPLSAIDWTLEFSTNLSDPTSWQAVTELPEDTDYFHTKTFNIPVENGMFFRLKK